MPQKIILHIDMNSYFASVEQQANPFLRGRPVAVCAYLSPGGVIIASSLEAKQKGIKTGCTVRDAKILDPKTVFIENEPSKYRSTTEKIFNILKKYSDTVEPYSIDEAFVDLTGWKKNFNEATVTAENIKKIIKKEVGEWLKCSIGISWTKFLAKFAGDIAPKNSSLIIENKEKLAAILKGRPLQDAWGINIRTEKRLNELRIYTLEDLKNYDPIRLKKIMGWPGYYLWANLNGVEINKVNGEAPLPKSIGHSYCLAKKTADKKYLRTIFYKLCEKTGRRMRQQNLEGARMHVGWAYTRNGGVHKSFKTPEKLFTTESIFQNVDKVLENSKILMPVRMIFVSVTQLSSFLAQKSLFEDNLSKKELSRAMDKINDKFGEFTLMRGQMFGIANLAKDRIGFRKIN